MATRIVMGLLAAALALAGDAAFAGKPEVLVQFEIAVPAFKRNLPQRAQAEQAVAAAVAAELERQYVFAHWLAQAPAQPQMQLGQLVLRMDQNADMQPNPQVFVHWFGARAGPGAELKELGFTPIEIYSPGNPNWDTNSAADFETRLLAKTMEKVRTDAFHDEFFKRFVARLPIASAVVPQAADRVIEIPLRWNEVLFSSETELVVRFDKLVDQTKQEGTMTLGQLAARVGPTATPAAPAEFPALLRGSITKASFDARPITLDPQNWNDQLLQILSGAKAFCYISVYKPRDELAGDSDRLGL
jgi:hypothetical protein